MNDPSRHLENGVTQYVCVETLVMKLGGRARRVLDNFIDKWDHTKEDNPDYEDATAREAILDVWRTFYKRKAILDLSQIYVAAGGKAPVRLDALEDFVEEPVELDEFLEVSILIMTHLTWMLFQVSAHTLSMQT